MSDYIKREDATAVIRKTLGSLGNSVVTEINSLSGYVTQDYARFTQESTQDLIIREDAREAIEKLMDIHFDRQVVLAKARDAIVSLPSAECDDCIWHVCNYNKIDWAGEDGYISRQDAMGAVQDHFNADGFKGYDDGQKMMDRIKALPSADSPTVDKEYLIDLIQEAVYDGEACAKLMDMVDRPTGRWVPVTNGRGGHECDQCHDYAPSWATGEERLTNFCPNCGSFNGGADK